MNQQNLARSSSDKAAMVSHRVGMLVNNNSWTPDPLDIGPPWGGGSAKAGSANLACQSAPFDGIHHKRLKAAALEINSAFPRPTCHPECSPVPDGTGHSEGSRQFLGQMRGFFPPTGGSVDGLGMTAGGRGARPLPIADFRFQSAAGGGIRQGENRRDGPGRRGRLGRQPVQARRRRSQAGRRATAAK